MAMRKKILGLVVMVLLGCGNAHKGNGMVFIENLKMNNGIAYYKSSLFTGISFDKYNNGQLKGEANYKDGIHKEWYQKGQLKAEVNFIDGKKESLG